MSQRHERFTDGRAAYAELFGEAGFIQALAGLELKKNSHVAQAVEDFFPPPATRGRDDCLHVAPLDAANLNAWRGGNVFQPRSQIQHAVQYTELHTSFPRKSNHVQDQWRGSLCPHAATKRCQTYFWPVR